MSIIETKERRSFVTIMQKYGALPPTGPYDFEKFLYDKPIPEDDHEELLRSIAFVYDRKLLRDVSKHGESPCYVCTCCKTFSLKFKEENGELRLLHDHPSTNFRHSLFCTPTNDLPKDCRRKSMIVQNIPAVQDFFKTCFQAPNFDSHATRKNLNAVLRKEGFDIEVGPTMHSNLKKHFREVYRKDLLMYNELLAQYLRKYVELNPNASVNLETDQNSCFFRSTVFIENAAHFFRNACIPAIFLDGTHIRIPEHDGIGVPIIGVDGNGSNIPLGFGLIPSENKQGMIYILLMMYQAGFNFEEFPVFTDRGHILAAVRALAEHYGLVVSVKYCLIHILRNIYHLFNINQRSREGRAVAWFMREMQSAPDVNAFLDAAKKLVKALPQIEENETLSTGARIVIYVLGTIHPTHWTVFGNTPSQHESMWEPLYFTYLAEVNGFTEISGDVDEWRWLLNDHVPVGNKFPLYGFCSTNHVESAQQWLLHHEVRTNTPPLAISNFLMAAAESLRQFRDEITTKSARFLTIYFRSLQDTGNEDLDFVIEDAEGCPDGSLKFKLYAEKHKKTEYVTYEPTSTPSLYCSCSRTAMREIYCGHINLVSRTRSSTWPSIPPSVFSQFYEEFGKVPTSGDRRFLTEFLNNYPRLDVPGFGDIKLAYQSENIYPSPTYTDKLNSGNRIISNGEPGPRKSKKKKQSALESARMTKEYEPSSKNKLSRNNDAIAEAIAADGLFDFGTKPKAEHMQQLESTLGRKRRDGKPLPRHCFHCRSPNHTIRQCLDYLKDDRRYMDPALLETGAILVNHFPTCVIDMDAGITSEDLDNDDTSGGHGLHNIDKIGLVEDSDAANAIVQSRILKLTGEDAAEIHAEDDNENNYLLDMDLAPSGSNRDIVVIIRDKDYTERRSHEQELTMVDDVEVGIHDDSRLNSAHSGHLSTILEDEDVEPSTAHNAFASSPATTEYSVNEMPTTRTKRRSKQVTNLKAQKASPSTAKSSILKTATASRPNLKPPPTTTACASSPATTDFSLVKMATRKRKRPKQPPNQKAEGTSPATTDSSIFERPTMKSQNLKPPPDIRAHALTIESSMNENTTQKRKRSKLTANSRAKGPTHARKKKLKPPPIAEAKAGSPATAVSSIVEMPTMKRGNLRALPRSHSKQSNNRSITIPEDMIIKIPKTEPTNASPATSASDDSSHVFKRRLDIQKKNASPAKSGNLSDDSSHFLKMPLDLRRKNLAQNEALSSSFSVGIPKTRRTRRAITSPATATSGTSSQFLRTPFDLRRKIVDPRNENQFSLRRQQVRQIGVAPLQPPVITDEPSKIVSYFYDTAYPFVGTIEQLNCLVQEHEFDIPESFTETETNDLTMKRRASTRKRKGANQRGLVSENNIAIHVRGILLQRQQKERSGIESFITVGTRKNGNDLIYNKEDARGSLRSLLFCNPVQRALIKVAESSRPEEGKKHHIKVLSGATASITSECLEIMNSQCYFNDAIVNSFLESITSKTVTDEGVIAHPSYVMSNLWDSANQNIKREGRLQLSSAFVALNSMTKSNNLGIHLFPMCKERHWWLMVVDADNRVIYSLDSLEDPDDHYSNAVWLSGLFKLRAVRQQLECASTSEQQESTLPDFAPWEYQEMRLPNKLLQHDGHSCGPYVCFYAATILKHGRRALNERTWFLDSISEIGVGDDLRPFVFDVMFQLAE
jgi:hypothetical protein